MSAHTERRPLTPPNSLQKSRESSRPISRESSKDDKTSRRDSLKALRSSLMTPSDLTRRRLSIATTPDDADRRRLSITTTPDNADTQKEDKATDVASKYTSKVSKFMDYYNEALRRRFIRELNKPTPKFEPKAESDSDHSDKEEEPKKTKEQWTKVFKKVDTINKIGAIGKEVEVSSTEKQKKANLRAQGIALIMKRKGVQEVQKLLRKMEVRKRFRKKVRIIIFCIRCVQEHCFRFRERSELTPYMNTLNDIDYTSDQVSDLMFDRSMFRAQRKMRISEETKKILSARKAGRTDQEVYTAQIALRNIRSFAELPVRMQQMIAQAGQYESYEGKRVITREGHPASAFYFILSGAVVAMKMDPERPIASAVDHYSKGDTFEENPLVGDTVREVTILTKEPCEFLSISAADYKNIFMQGGVKNLSDPDQESFLKNLHFLNGWPIVKLQEHPKECRFHYFRRGTVLSDDTQKSKWLIIVKSGSLSVMKKLKKVGPFEWRKKGDIKPLTEKERRERKHEKEQWRRYVLPEIRLPLKQKKEVEEVEERVDGKPKPFEHPDIKIHREMNDIKGSKYCYPNLWTYTGTGTDEEDKTAAFSNINKQFLYIMSSSGQNSHDKGSAGKKVGSAVARHSTMVPKVVIPRPSSETRYVPSPTHSTVSLRSLLASSLGDDTERTTSSVFDERLKRIADENGVTGVEVSELDLNPQFVQIQTLIKGDVWGLADLMLDEQPSFMIISNGADCLLISKHFYIQHCSDKLQRQLKQDLCPYPSDFNLQESLQVSVDWNEHRRCELSTTMQVVRNKHPMREEVFLPRGQESCCES